MSDKGTEPDYHYYYGKSDEPIDAEYVEDLEYKVLSFRVDGPSFITEAIDQTTQDLLNTGWNLYNEIVCPPFVMLFFSREKEENKE